jgi:putative transposase
MPATKTKRIKKLVDEFSAPKVIEHQIGVLKKTKQGRTKYKSGATNFNLVIVKDDVGIKRTFATNLGVEEKDVFNLFKLYSKRWGIETSYRVKGEFKPKTTSKNYVVRLFYFLFSVCLYNLLSFLEPCFTPFGMMADNQRPQKERRLDKFIII